MILVSISTLVALTFTTADATGKTADICSLPPDPGLPCDQTQRLMWYYDGKSGTCRQFLYSGCGGNDNRFSSGDVCFATCPDLYGACFENPDDGRICEGWFEQIKYFYNPYSKVCERQLALGCVSATRNTFVDAAACELQCVNADRKISDVCHLPLQRGSPCGKGKLASSRYYYDPQSRRCLQFVYNGCGVMNRNNFPSLENCEKTCGYTTAACALDVQMDNDTSKCSRPWYYFRDGRCHMVNDACSTDPQGNGFGPSVNDCQAFCLPYEFNEFLRGPCPEGMEFTGRYCDRNVSTPTVLNKNFCHLGSACVFSDGENRYACCRFV